MKKILFTFFASALMNLAVNAQCTVDATNTDFFNPTPDSVPCAQQGVAYDETLQMFIPQSVDLQDYVPNLPIPYTLNVDSVVLNDVTGLPTGLSWSSNPAGPVFLGGTNLCGRTFGTTNEPAADYPITFDGLIYLSGQAFQGIFDGDTTITIDQLLQAQYGSSYSLKVVEQGQNCDGITVGIKDANNNLSAAVSVMPNPSNGMFTVKINSEKQMKGNIIITDVIGKQVYAENLNTKGNYTTAINLSNLSKGLYTLIVRTANGNTAKNISIE